MAFSLCCLSTLEASPHWITELKGPFRQPDPTECRNPNEIVFWNPFSNRFFQRVLIFSCLYRQLFHNSNFSSSNGSTEDLFRDSIDSCDNDITEKVSCFCVPLKKKQHWGIGWCTKEKEWRHFPDFWCTKPKKVCYHWLRSIQKLWDLQLQYIFESLNYLVRNYWIIWWGSLGSLNLYNLGLIYMKTGKWFN